MRTLILILMLGCTACTLQARDSGFKAPVANPATAPATAPGADGGDALARMRALIGTASCTESSQCRTVAVGAQACGGPQAYLPYSQARTDEKALLALAGQHRAEVKARLADGGMMSICRHLPDPGAVCVSGSCQLGASSPAPR
ncbi:hypothetical protein [Massilia sp. MS-15]|uniref:hypothetical protein n=1 Tax=Massilia sp. MS-15 TaxID=2878200 RepID=UPI001CD75FCD|nr:hypothetical protein [Massilia sp. MS-15]MCA1247060.1 hypothetical protein [Massilia sp. MS-15]